MEILMAGTVPDSFFSVESLETIESNVSLPPLSGGRRNPNHEESSKNQITTESLRDSIESVENQWIHERILGFSRLASMGYNNLWFESRQPDFSIFRRDYSL
jgi:hypothetical protein